MNIFKYQWFRNATSTNFRPEDKLNFSYSLLVRNSFTVGQYTQQPISSIVFDPSGVMGSGHLEGAAARANMHKIAVIHLTVMAGGFLPASLLCLALLSISSFSGSPGDFLILLGIVLLLVAGVVAIVLDIARDINFLRWAKHIDRAEPPTQLGGTPPTSRVITNGEPIDLPNGS